MPKTHKAGVPRNGAPRRFQAIPANSRGPGALNYAHALSGSMRASEIVEPPAATGVERSMRAPDEAEVPVATGWHDAFVTVV